MRCNTAASLDAFTGFGSFLRPESAAVFSAMIAVGSVVLNLWGGLLTERKRAEIQQEVSVRGGGAGLAGWADTAGSVCVCGGAGRLGWLAGWLAGW